MYRLIDFYNNRVVLMDCDTMATRGVKQEEVIELLKSNEIKVDNAYLNKDRDKILCTYGKIERLDQMTRIATIIEVQEYKDKSKNEYIIYTCERYGFKFVTDIRKVTRDFIIQLIHNEIVFNGFIRNNSEIVIKGPVKKVKIKEKLDK